MLTIKLNNGSEFSSVVNNLRRLLNFMLDFGDWDFMFIALQILHGSAPVEVFTLFKM